MVRLAETTPQEISSQAGHFRYLEKTGSSLTILRSSGYASWRDHRDFPVHIRHVSSAIAPFSRECAILHRTPGRVVAFFLNEEERTHPQTDFRCTVSYLRILCEGSAVCGSFERRRH